MTAICIWHSVLRRICHVLLMMWEYGILLGWCSMLLAWCMVRLCRCSVGHRRGVLLCWLVLRCRRERRVFHS